MSGILNLINGWKTIAAWILLQIPQLTDYPGLLSAIQEAIAHGNRQTFTNLLVQALMVIGVAHRAVKNLK